MNRKMTFRIIFLIFVMGLVGSNYPMKAEAIAVAHSFQSQHSNSIAMEIFKYIKGYEGQYQVSNFGRVKSLSRFIKNNRGVTRFVSEKILIPKNHNQGYLAIALGRKESDKLIHRLVAESFIPNPENKKTVNHKNGVKFDNRDENLEWLTQSENSKHSFKELGRKAWNIGMNGKYAIGAKAVIQMNLDGDFIAEYSNATEASRVTNIFRQSIGKACLGKYHSAGGYKWNFKKLQL